MLAVRLWLRYVLMDFPTGDDCGADACPVVALSLVKLVGNQLRLPWVYFLKKNDVWVVGSEDSRLFEYFLFRLTILDFGPWDNSPKPIPV